MIDDTELKHLTQRELQERARQIRITRAHYVFVPAARVVEFFLEKKQRADFEALVANAKRIEVEYVKHGRDVVQRGYEKILFEKESGVAKEEFFYDMVLKNMIKLVGEDVRPPEERGGVPLRRLREQGPECRRPRRFLEAR